MTLALNDSDRVRLTVTVTVDLDPATATVALHIDGTAHPCTWIAAATQTDGQWTRTAVTDGYLAGPALPAGSVNGATVLDYGVHTLEVVVINGPTIKAIDLPPFLVE